MERFMDVAGLEPPEPLERILDGIAGLREGDWLHIHLDRDPLPLYGMLRSMGYLWRVSQEEGRKVDLLIWPKGQTEPYTD